jgi:hypothetical protein
MAENCGHTGRRQENVNKNIVELAEKYAQIATARRRLEAVRSELSKPLPHFWRGQTLSARTEAFEHLVDRRRVPMNFGAHHPYLDRFQSGGEAWAFPPSHAARNALSVLWLWSRKELRASRVVSRPAETSAQRALSAALVSGGRRCPTGAAGR